VPYGPKFHARKIEKLLYTKDLRKSGLTLWLCYN